MKQITEHDIASLLATNHHLPSEEVMWSDTNLILVVNDELCFHSGWAQRRLPSMDTDDFETIPSSAEESSNSSEEEGNNKNVSRARHSHSAERMREGSIYISPQLLLATHL